MSKKQFDPSNKQTLLEYDIIAEGGSVRRAFPDRDIAASAMSFSRLMSRLKESGKMQFVDLSKNDLKLKNQTKN